MSQELEKQYDLIVTGTDLTSSLVSAAVSRIGKKVLHLDPYDRYGQDWSALKLFDILSAPSALVKAEYDVEDKPQLSESSLRCVPLSTISNVQLFGDVFDNADSCDKFFQDFFPNVSTETINRFQQYFYPQLKSCKSAKDAKEILGQMKDELSALNSLDNSFSIDLVPRFLFSLGEMVTILIRSNVTRYLEFRKIARILTPLIKQETDKAEDFPEGSSFKLINVPCTRNDVFKSSNLSMIEKRLLMKCLEFITNYKKTPEAYQQYESMQFDQCLQEQRLTPKLRDLLVNSVLMDSPQIPTKEALERINRFMSAIGRYADRPYLIPTYGTDDLVQAFCRYSAIYGATYCLNTLVKEISVDNTSDDSPKCTAVTINSQEQQIATDYVVTNYQIANFKASKRQSKTISRAIVCSRQSICSDGIGEYDNTSVLYLPTSITGSKNAVYVFETDKSTNACPKGLYIQFFWCDSTDSSSALVDLKPVIELVHSATVSPTPKKEESYETEESTKATVSNPLWSLYFNQSYDVPTYEQNIPSNLFFVSPPINELDFDFVVQEAREIFHKMYPEEEFFPETKEPSNDNFDDENEEKQEGENKMENDEKVEESNEQVEKQDIETNDDKADEVEMKQTE